MSSLSFLEQIACIAKGPFIGSRTQEGQLKVASHEAASIMSTSSRVFNAAWGLYAAAGCMWLRSLGCETPDIDLSYCNIVTLTGLWAGCDSLARECSSLFQYYSEAPRDSHFDPIGSSTAFIQDILKPALAYSNFREAAVFTKELAVAVYSLYR